MVFVYDLVASRTRTPRSWLQQLVVGLVLGAIGITVMLTHWTFGSGVIFDTRSVLLCVSGLFFGPIPTVVATLATGTFRFLHGGPAEWTRIATVVNFPGPSGSRGGVFDNAF
jgi:hypothetical protein